MNQAERPPAPIPPSNSATDLCLRKPHPLHAKLQRGRACKASAEHNKHAAPPPNFATAPLLSVQRRRALHRHAPRLTRLPCALRAEISFPAPPHEPRAGRTQRSNIPRKFRRRQVRKAPPSI